MTSSSNHDAFSVLASIFESRSSLHPTFLTVLDGTFILLFLVFIVLAFLTSGNIHLFVLMGIELALWASVKWVVKQLQSVTIPEQQLQEDRGQETKKSL